MYMTYFPNLHDECLSQVLLIPCVQFSAVCISDTYTQKSFSPVLGLIEKYSFLLLLLLQRCFTSIETVRTIRNGERGSSTSTFTQLVSSDTLVRLRCFTSTEIIRLIRDGEPRTATSTFTQLLSSDTLVFDHLSLNRLCILAWHLKHRFKPAVCV